MAEKSQANRRAGAAISKDEEHHVADCCAFALAMLICATTYGTSHSAPDEFKMSPEQAEQFIDATRQAHD
jgi:hypothetical protein